MTTFTGSIPTIASGDTTTVPTNLATYRDCLKAASEAWTAYTPTLTGFTQGNGTLLARYRQVNKTVDVRFRFVVGSTSTFSATLIVAPPVSLKADYGLYDALGTCALFDTSAGTASRTGGNVVWDSSTPGFFFLFDRTAAGAATVTNTTPWTWATGDTLSFQVCYEAA